MSEGVGGAPQQGYFNGMKIGTITVALALSTVVSLATPALASPTGDVDNGRSGPDVVRYVTPNAFGSGRHHLRHFGRRGFAHRRIAHRAHRRVDERRRHEAPRHFTERHIAHRARHRHAHTRLARRFRHDEARNAMAAVHPADMMAHSRQRSLGGSRLVSEARRWIGTNPTGRSRLWCARFMNFVLRRTGHSGTSSDMARSFASYGHRVRGPRVGAIAVMSRHGGGHVGVVSGFDDRGNPIIISGNHGHRVAEAVYSRSRIYAYVVP
jgi:uncharacterized protein (TIGR02594 family)